ncbi:hypothetical protein Fcan01_28470 [Folsomia candida]|uniref:Uncharacterized protein n=1 Tax=Folsomia candida TaxID=158441 RepID=A0A226CWL0_FOLCA|nr:hypothetical protein Fcan01_28470 [Folsomia candida]
MEFTSGFPFTKPGSGLQDKGGSDEEQPQWTHYLLSFIINSRGGYGGGWGGWGHPVHYYHSHDEGGMGGYGFFGLLGLGALALLAILFIPRPVPGRRMNIRYDQIPALDELPGKLNHIFGKNIQ